jgi:hypothetical protein
VKILDVIPNDNTLNLLGMELIKLLAMYILLPSLAVAAILRLLKIRGKALGWLNMAAGLVGLYFLGMGLK